MKQQLLNDIENVINVKSLNYTLFLRICEIPVANNDDLNSVIRRAFGENSLIHDQEEISAKVICDEVQKCLFYAGDEGAGPDAAVLQSDLFLELVDELCGELVQEAQPEVKTEIFQFKCGHPAYPVFWDFAFAFRHPDHTKIFIGSSSD